MTTHYATLGIAENASDEQIREAHRILVRANRADAGRIQAINTAFNTLKSPEKRRAYDEQLACARRTTSNTNSSTASNNSTRNRRSHSTSQSNQYRQSSPPPPPPPPPTPTPTPTLEGDPYLGYMIGMVFIFFVACYFFLPSKEKNSTSESQSVTTAAPLNAATANLLGLADDEDNSNQDAQVSNDYCASNEHWVKLADVCYQVELALDPFSRARGLGFRQSMPTGHGMLYPYDQEAIFSHGTKGMLFPLDILFFDNERRLVGLHHNAPPCSIDNNTCPSYSSHRPARYALELNAGQANELNLKLGDELIIRPTIFHEYESYKSSLCKIQDKIKRFSIPANMLEQQQRLVHLILCTESMDDTERQYWFDILPSMNETQVSRLFNILETERVKLAELEVKYQQEIMALNQKHLDGMKARRDTQNHSEDMDEDIDPEKILEMLNNL